MWNSRVRDVESFWKTGELNEASNVQFGEGGAGTVSDGKLNTLVKDSEGEKSGGPEHICQRRCAGGHSL